MTDLSKKLIRTISFVCLVCAVTAVTSQAVSQLASPVDQNLYTQAALSPSILDEIYAEQASDDTDTADSAADSADTQTAAAADTTSAAAAQPAEKKQAETAQAASAAETKTVQTPVYDLQTNYPDTPYQTTGNLPANATISSAGCCPVSVGNILRKLCGISDATTANVCALATSSGARYNGGTDPLQLLEAAKNQWGGFTYTYADSMDAVQQCLASGGMVLAHTSGSSGGRTNLFSDNGHFVALVSGDAASITAVDPYWTETKWTENDLRKASAVETAEHGVVTIQTNAVSGACDYYYLIYKAE